MSEWGDFAGTPEATSNGSLPTCSLLSLEMVISKGLRWFPLERVEFGECEDWLQVGIILGFRFWLLPFESSRSGTGYLVEMWVTGKQWCSGGGAEASLPSRWGFESGPCHWLAMCPWTCYSTGLGLSFLIRKVRILCLPGSFVVRKGDNAYGYWRWPSQIGMCLSRKLRVAALGEPITQQSESRKNEGH